MAKDASKGWMTVVLEKEGSPEITVTCPRKVKMNPFRALVSWRVDGFPQFNVTPKDWKGFFLYLLAWLLVFIFGSIMLSAFGESRVEGNGELTEGEVNGVLAFVGFLLTVAALVLNVIITANYYYSFIKKALKRGYVINDAEQRAACEAAGLYK